MKYLELPYELKKLINPLLTIRRSLNHFCCREANSNWFQNLSLNPKIKKEEIDSLSYVFHGFIYKAFVNHWKDHILNTGFCLWNNKQIISSTHFENFNNNMNQVYFKDDKFAKLKCFNSRTIKDIVESYVNPDMIFLVIDVEYDLQTIITVLKLRLKNFDNNAVRKYITSVLLFKIDTVLNQNICYRNLWLEMNCRILNLTESIDLKLQLLNWIDSNKW